MTPRSVSIRSVSVHSSTWGIKERTRNFILCVCNAVERTNNDGQNARPGVPSPRFDTNAENVLVKDGGQHLSSIERLISIVRSKLFFFSLSPPQRMLSVFAAQFVFTQETNLLE